MIQPPHSERAREIWIERFLIKPHWDFVEVLAWIAFGDGPLIADLLQFGASPLYAERPDVAAATMILNAVEKAGRETEPLDMLELALLRGDVIAFGSFEVGSGEAFPTKIEAADWQYLQFRRQDNWPYTFVRDRRFRAGHAFAIRYGMRFDRASAMLTFPETKAKVAASGFDLASEADVRSAIAEFREKGHPPTIRGMGRVFATRELGRGHADLAKRIEAYRKQFERLWSMVERLDRSTPCP